MTAKVSEWGWGRVGRRESCFLNLGLLHRTGSCQSDWLLCTPWSLAPPGRVAGDLFLSFSFVICNTGWWSCLTYKVCCKDSETLCSLDTCHRSQANTACVLGQH